VGTKRLQSINIQSQTKKKGLNRNRGGATNVYSVTTKKRNQGRAKSVVRKKLGQWKKTFTWELRSRASLFCLGPQGRGGLLWAGRGCRNQPLWKGRFEERLETRRKETKKGGPKGFENFGAREQRGNGPKKDTRQQQTCKGRKSRAFFLGKNPKERGGKVRGPT